MASSHAIETNMMQYSFRSAVLSSCGFEDDSLEYIDAYKVPY